MSRPQSLEETVRAALQQHADTAQLPLSEAHVRAQAVVAVRAAQAWSAATTAAPMPPFPLLRPREYKPRQRPAADDPPPDHPTPPGTHCTRLGCEPIERAVGWRWYLDGGWRPACDRHMSGAALGTRRYNSEYLEDGAR